MFCRYETDKSISKFQNKRKMSIKLREINKTMELETNMEIIITWYMYVYFLYLCKESSSISEMEAKMLTLTDLRLDGQTDIVVQYLELQQFVS